MKFYLMETQEKMFAVMCHSPQERKLHQCSDCHTMLQTNWKTTSHLFRKFLIKEPTAHVLVSREEQLGEAENNQSLQQVKSPSILTTHLGRVDKVMTYV